MKAISRRLHRVDFGSATNYVLLLVIAFFMFYPLWYVSMYALSDPVQVRRAGAILLPQGFTLNTLRFVLTSPVIQRAYINTLFVVGVGTVLSTSVTSLYAYGMSRRIAGVKAILLLTYFTFLFNGGMIPTYYVVRQTGLLNSLWSLILPVLMSPFFAFIMAKFFRSIPDSLMESAKIDGANDLTIFFRIVVPLSLPAIVTISLFYAVTYWNSFFQAIIYLSDSSKWPVQVRLREMLMLQEYEPTGMASGDQTVAGVTPATTRMATVVVVVVPVVLIYPFLQKHFVKGIMLGAVKG